MTGRLASPRVPLLAALLAVTLCLPALWGGWAMDDYLHRAAFLRPLALSGLRGVVTEATPTGLFRFFDGDPDHVRAGMELGTLPWWTVPVLRAQFFRPLTYFTHWLDYRLWPDSAALMHAQSLLWFGALVFSVGLLYRRFLGPTVAAGLAALLFAMDPAHGAPAGWIANRNALVAGLFGVLAIAAHDRARREGWRVGACLAPVLFAGSLLSAEAGFSVLGYLVAHAVLLEDGAWRRRLTALVPYAAVAAAWRAAASAFGVGSVGLGFYVDPGRDPAGFLAAMGARAPLLLLGQLSPLPADLAYVARSEASHWLWTAGLLVGALFLAAVVPLLSKDRPARFFALGAALSLVPMCAAFPDDRLMLIPGIGILAVLGQWAAVTASRWKWLGLWSRLLVAGAGGAAAAHFAVAPLFLPLRAKGFTGVYAPMYLSVPLDEKVARQSLIFANAPVAFLVSHLPIVRAVRGEPVPRSTRVLSPSLAAVSIARPDEKTLVFTPRGGYLAVPADTLFRSGEFPLHAGERVVLPDVTLEVLSLNQAGRPAAVRCRFRVPLEDRSLRWLRWEEGGYVPFTPPPVGGQVELEPAVPNL